MYSSDPPIIMCVYTCVMYHYINFVLSAHMCRCLYSRYNHSLSQTYTARMSMCTWLHMRPIELSQTGVEGTCVQLFLEKQEIMVFVLDSDSSSTSSTSGCILIPSDIQCA